MDVLTAILTLCALASFAADVRAIVKGDRKQAMILLVILMSLVLALFLQAMNTARVEAENRLLTNTQVRAQRLIDAWTNSDRGFDEEFVSEGEGEGIASAAADLMEDTRECRPEASKEAHERLRAAREKAAKVTYPVSALDGGSKLDADLRILDIWQAAASAAYQQVLGVSRVPPNC